MKKVLSGLVIITFLSIISFSCANTGKNNTTEDPKEVKEEWEGFFGDVDSDEMFERG